MSCPRGAIFINHCAQPITRQTQSFSNGDLVSNLIRQQQDQPQIEPPALGLSETCVGLDQLRVDLVAGAAQVPFGSEAHAASPLARASAEAIFSVVGSANRAATC